MPSRILQWFKLCVVERKGNADVEDHPFVALARRLSNVILEGAPDLS